MWLLLWPLVVQIEAIRTTIKNQLTNFYLGTPNVVPPHLQLGHFGSKSLEYSGRTGSITVFSPGRSHSVGTVQ